MPGGSQLLSPGRAKRSCAGSGEVGQLVVSGEVGDMDSGRFGVRAEDNDMV